MTPEQFAKSGTEHGHQVALFAWAALNVGKYPELQWLHAIPNGGLRDKITAGKLKAEGVRKGVSDVSLPVRRKVFSGLYIEMKKPGGKASKEQIEFGEFVQNQGFLFYVCDNWQYAANIIESYLGMEK